MDTTFAAVSSAGASSNVRYAFSSETSQRTIIAEAALFPVSDTAKYMTGARVIVDGPQTCGILTCDAGVRSEIGLRGGFRLDADRQGVPD